MFFHDIPEAPADRIFGLTGAYAADPRPQKVDLLVGIYKNERLESEMMPSVRQAQRELHEERADYLPMDGWPAFVEAVGALLFGAVESRMYGAQSVGGTGSLRVVGEFLAHHVTKRIYVPHLTWPNHHLVFERAGLQVESYPYYSRVKGGFDGEAMLAFLAKVPAKSAVLLHATCHNPTGCDPTGDEWRALAELMRARELLPFFDCAYQGFGEGLAADAAAVRLFAKEGLEFLVSYSCSKNFSLYCQRVGALFVVDENATVRTRVGSQIKRIIRGLYSNPPAHGALIVDRILNGPLRGPWEKELGAMRERIQRVRKELVSRLIAKAKKRDFRPLLKHRGMFSFIELEAEQVEQLIQQHAVYILQNGRISVAGLNKNNLEYVADSLIAVTE